MDIGTCFYDTNRGHMIKGIITLQDDETFTIRDKHDEEWIFEIVTIDMFLKEKYFGNLPYNRRIMGGRTI